MENKIKNKIWLIIDLVILVLSFMPVARFVALYLSENDHEKGMVFITLQPYILFGIFLLGIVYFLISLNLRTSKNIDLKNK